MYILIFSINLSVSSVMSYTSYTAIAAHAIFYNFVQLNRLLNCPAAIDCLLCDRGNVILRNTTSPPRQSSFYARAFIYTNLSICRINLTILKLIDISSTSLVASTHDDQISNRSNASRKRWKMLRVQ